MFFRWLKQYLPRGLYGRAALILILPVVVLQIVVSVAFVQRHFEDATIQMTQTVLRELSLVLDRMEDAPDAASALAATADLGGALGLTLAFNDAGTAPPSDAIRWYDFTGHILAGQLRAALPQLRAVDLPDSREALVYLNDPRGVLRIAVERRSLSPYNPHQLLVTMVFFGVLMTVIAYLYLRNQLRPITRLAAAAQAFGRGRSVPYSPSGAVEVRAAGHAFLDMRARIERQIEQRTMMLSGVSHDLRTPLTRLKLALSLMEENEAAPMLKDVDEMERLVSEFLNFAKGATEGEPEPADLLELVRAVVADHVRMGHDVTLIEVAPQGGVVLVRPAAIRRALDNLIGNALRYGTRAEVSVTYLETACRLRVEDDGPGIPEDRRAEALKPFTRLDPARNQDRGSGVGLGLAIAMDIARAHGGTLRLGRSERLGGLQADIVVAR